MRHIVFLVFIAALLMFWSDPENNENIIEYMDKTESTFPLPDAPNPGEEDFITYEKGLASYHNIRLMPGMVFVGKNNPFSQTKANKRDKRVNRRIPRNKESV